MSELLDKLYNPHEVEDKWYKFWEENNLFAANSSSKKKPFSIVIPPPNVTGILHMGHALNNAIQDILIRYHRLKGEEALWMPGTDHAGIATQNVVEKSIAKENLKRQDLGREEFIKRVWLWKDKYGSTIIHQLKKLGSSCDWNRERFTMDEEYSKAVKKVFIELWNKGLIYRDAKVINFCPRCQTALSDEEAPHSDVAGNLYYIKYPLAGVVASGAKQSKDHDCFVASAPRNDTGVNYIVVATTRPETMLGDTAVVVNPKDKRYKGLIGKTIILPLVNREIKIIADASVDMEFGTGAVKVTPAHDPNDYALGKKHKLEFINVMHPDATMNELAGKFVGMDRFKAREAVLEELKNEGLIEKIEPHQLSAGHCYRCHTIIEPYLSRQWFVKMKPLARPALEAVKKGKIKFYPERWTKVYLNWMENIHDWCISRQIWWGHRIPLWYCLDCQKEVIASDEKPVKCRKCKSTNLKQDEDVLDTWFSSWLWPFATFKNKEDLKYFYPTSTLVTAPEIIFFWVARMIMAGYEFMGKLPFKDVYIHGTVRDAEGKKMSKSLGNSIDPLEIISTYGTDALRFSLISITAGGQDVFLSEERFEQGRNFANKIWNASRFILMNLDAENTKSDLCVFFKSTKLSLSNRWILSRFYSTLRDVENDLDTYKFNEAANTLYSFFWHEFCDWYLELIKPEIKNKNNQLVMFKVLEKFLRLLHPLMPFITEEIWQKLQLNPPVPPFGKGWAKGGFSIMTQSWPHLQGNIIDKKTEEDMELVFELINLLRNMRAELEVPLSSLIKVKVYSEDKKIKELFLSVEKEIKNLSKAESLSLSSGYQVNKNEYAGVLRNIPVVIPLSGLVDIGEYLKKIEVKISKLKQGIANKETTLSNKNFTAHAPKEIVEIEKEKLRDMIEQLKKLEGIKDGLQ